MTHQEDQDAATDARGAEYDSYVTILQGIADKSRGESVGSAYQKGFDVGTAVADTTFREVLRSAQAKYGNIMAPVSAVLSTLLDAWEEDS